jgi:NADH-quinone oxidoreductase subunit N
VQSGVGLWLIVLAILFAAISIYYYFKLIQAMYFVEGEPAIQVLEQGYKYKLLVFAILVLGLGILPNIFLSYLYF